MATIRLRTKFLLSLVVTTAVLTGAVLLIVQHYLQTHARDEIHEALHNSVVTFQQFELQRQRALAQSAALLADLPNLRALMTTEDAPTIQDASADLWHLTGSDLFVLAGRTGKVMAIHTSATGFTTDAAQSALTHTLQAEQTRDWWYWRRASLRGLPAADLFRGATRPGSSGRPGPGLRGGQAPGRCGGANCLLPGGVWLW